MSSSDPSDLLSVASRTNVRYPSPFFDVSQTYMPRNIKEMLKWCVLYWAKNEVVNSAITKLASYPITNIIIETDDEELKKEYEKIYKHKLQLKKFVKEVGLDYFATGNCFISVYTPKRRWLICKHCEKREKASDATYRWKGYQFILTCKSCKAKDVAVVHDQDEVDISRVNLKRWPGFHIDIDHNEITGTSVYKYNIPNYLKKQIMSGTPRSIIEETPWAFIEAAKQDAAVVLSPGNIYHFSRPNISIDNYGWGFPIILPVLGALFSRQILIKASEVMAQQHIVPLWVIFPAAQGEASPYTHMNLGSWRTRVEDEIMKWRRDPNYIPIMPLPLGFQYVGGDSKLPQIQSDIEQMDRRVLAGMGCPYEFIFGGISYCLDLDSYVFTDRGLETIGEITKSAPSHGNFSPDIDRKVSTHEGKSSLVAVHRSRQKVAHISTRLGLDGNPSHDHKYLVLRRDLSMDWVKAENLLPGDRVAVRSGMNLWPSNSPDISHIADKADAAYEGNKDYSNAYPVTIPRSLTPELARILGYLISEGSSDDRRFSFSQKDPEIMSDFIDCIERTFGYRLNAWESSGCQGAEIGRRKIVKYLKLLGAGGKAHEKKVPECIRMAPKNIVSEFIKAYMEGDGGLSGTKKKQAVVATSISDDLLKVIQLLLLNFGIVSSRYPKYKGRCQSLVIRSEYVDIYAKEIGFISNRKISDLLDRTPTRPAHVGERIPYAKELLDDFRHKYFNNRSSWVFESVCVDLNKESYTTKEVADITGRTISMVSVHINKGRLKAKMAPGIMGRFGGYVISRNDLYEFLNKWGRGRRRTIPARDAYGMTYGKLTKEDLSFIRDNDKEFAERIDIIIKSKYIWDEIKEVELYEEESEMGDLTVDAAHSFIGDGLVCHNSGGSVGLRMLENTFLEYVEDVEDMINSFIVNIVDNYRGATKRARIRMGNLKMMDDVQQKQNVMNLNSATRISDETLLNEMGFDRKEEYRKMEHELKERDEMNRQRMINQAKAEGEAQLVSARYQAELAKINMQMQGMMQGIQSGSIPPPPGMEGVAQGTRMGTKGNGELTSERSRGEIDIPSGGVPIDMDKSYGVWAEKVSGMPRGERDAYLNSIKNTNPDVHEMLIQKLQEREGTAANMKPLPAQKPPRRNK